MSGKRRKQQRSRGRGPATARPAPGIRPQPEYVDADHEAPVPATSNLGPAAPPVPSRPAATSRYASSVSGPRRAAAATASTGTIDIDERVPYFSKDLRRIVITAGIMVALIIGGSLLLH